MSNEWENIKITKEEDEICNEESRYLYGYLRKKYCNDNVHDLDIILNSLCFSILRLAKIHVDDKDRKYFFEKIVFRILKQGMEQ